MVVRFITRTVAEATTDHNAMVERLRAVENKCAAVVRSGRRLSSNLREELSAARYMEDRTAGHLREAISRERSTRQEAAMRKVEAPINPFAQIGRRMAEDSARARYTNPAVMATHLGASPADFKRCWDIANNPGSRFGLTAEDTAPVVAWMSENRA